MDVVLFNDPACPFGYSATPDLTVLQWRYGDALRWRLVMIGLSETAERYEQAGFTPVRMVAGNRTFRDRYGMPFQLALRDRIVPSGRACRAIVAVRQLAPELEWPALRALQFAWFTGDAMLDEDEALHAALASVAGLDAAAVIERLDDAAVEAEYQADRALTRSAEGGPTHFQGKSANSDGAERFTAPSVQFSAGGATLEAGGFQSLAVYDACIANLDRALPRRPAADSVAEVLQAFPHGVTTQEVAAVMATGLEPPDRDGAELQLLEAVAAGQARRTPLGDDALWQTA